MASERPTAILGKATNVLFAAEGDLKVSARNVFKGEVTKVEKGAVNGRVTLRCEPRPGKSPINFRGLLRQYHSRWAM